MLSKKMEQSGSLSKMLTVICANPNCESKKDLQIAPYFVSAYFSLPIDPNGNTIKRVCKTCFGVAEDHQRILVQLLKEKQSILKGPKKPKNQTVSIDDEELVEQEVESPEEVEIEENIEVYVPSVMKKYQFQIQLDASIKNLGKFLQNYLQCIKESWNGSNNIILVIFFF